MWPLVFTQRASHQLSCSVTWQWNPFQSTGPETRWSSARRNQHRRLLVCNCVVVFLFYNDNGWVLDFKIYSSFFCSTSILVFVENLTRSVCLYLLGFEHQWPRDLQFSLWVEQWLVTTSSLSTVNNIISFQCNLPVGMLAKHCCRPVYPQRRMAASSHSRNNTVKSEWVSPEFAVQAQRCTCHNICITSTSHNSEKRLK